MTGYSEDLAYIHDAGFSDFARRAAPGLLSALHAQSIVSGLVVDLGCGSGIWAARLIEAGYDVLGIDISRTMIRLAKKKVPGAKFRVASLLSADIPACAAVTAIGEVINYTFDPRNNRRALRTFFRRVFDALRPGGMFVFDFANPGQISRASRRRIWSLGPDWAILLDAAEDKRTHTLVRNMTSFRKQGKLYRRTDETHVVRLYRTDAVVRELRRIGFRTRTSHTYGRMRLRAATAAIYAVKPEL